MLRAALPPGVLPSLLCPCRILWASLADRSKRQFILLLSYLRVGTWCSYSLYSAKVTLSQQPILLLEGSKHRTGKLWSTWMLLELLANSYSGKNSTWNKTKRHGERLKGRSKDCCPKGCWRLKV